MTYSLEWFQSEFIYLNKTDYTVMLFLHYTPPNHILTAGPYFTLLLQHKKYLTLYNFALKNTTQKLDPL
jgi:hypothetical protein